MELLLLGFGLFFGSALCVVVLSKLHTSRLHPSARELSALFLKDKALLAHYRRVGQTLAANDFIRTLAELEACLQRAPQSAELHFMTAFTLIQLDRKQAAHDHLERCLQLDPFHPGALILFARVQTDRALSDVYLNRAIQADPNDPFAAISIVGYYMEAYRYREALQFLEGWLKPGGGLRLDWRGERLARGARSQHTLLRLQRGLARAELNDPGAERDLTFPLSKNSSHRTNQRILQLRFYHSHGDSQRSQKIYEELLKLSSQPLVSFQLGMHHYAHGEYPQALQFYTAALEGSDQQDLRSNALAYLGWTHWKEQRPEQAQRYAEQALESTPDQLSALELIAQLALDNRSYAEALSALEHIRQLKAEDITLEHLSGQVAQATGEVEQARQHYRSCLEIAGRGGLIWEPERERARQADSLLQALERANPAPPAAPEHAGPGPAPVSN